MDDLYVDGQRISLDSAHLLQAGGEGMIFDLGRQALKRYHRPTPDHEAKLRYLLSPQIRQSWPDNVLAPQALARDGRGRVVGFQMARLPAGTYPVKKLASAPFCRQLGLDAEQVISLFREIHATLTSLHRAGFVVGDLNDHNLFFADPRDSAPVMGAHTFWVDVDSFQCGPHPCPVATQAFLDPYLYRIKDFGRQPVFTPLTDWYAFFVLLLKSLLHVHPYGGVHHRYKSLAKRAQARITAFAPGITYPHNARPPATLSDEILAHAERVFGQGERVPFPANLLSAYAASLKRCAHCRLAYPRTRTACPGCRKPAPMAAPAPGPLRQLVTGEGALLHVAVQPGGRIALIARTGEQYRLLRAGTGGMLDRRPLFAGRAGYRFGYFGQTVVVGDGHSRRLLLLDVSGPVPRQLTVLESDLFQDQAVFATTAAHLYRLANGSLLKGEVRHGHYLEEVVTTVHRRQTLIWSDPVAERIAGAYRIFDRYHFFLVNAYGRTYEVKSAPSPGREENRPGSVRALTARFGRERVAFLWQTTRAGRETGYGQLTGSRGESCYHFQPDLPEVRGLLPAGEDLLVPADGAILRMTPAGVVPWLEADTLTAGDRLLPHPAGILVCQPDALYLLPT